jgi:4a-hydroxytetrahydrobiopterin dehydratase
MTAEQAKMHLQGLPGWTLGTRTIEKEFRFGSYRAGLEFAHRIGLVAEDQDHHPDMLVGWRRVKVMLTTHALRGLSMNDFVMAAKTEVEYQREARGK